MVKDGEFLVLDGGLEELLERIGHLSFLQGSGGLQGISSVLKLTELLQRDTRDYQEYKITLVSFPDPHGIGKRATFDCLKFKWPRTAS